MERIEKKRIHGHPPLQRMSIRMFGRLYTVDPQADLELHVSNLGEEAQKQPGVFGFYATLRDLAQEKLEALEVALGDKEAEVDQEFRQSGMLPGGVKVTEDGLKKAIRNHDDVQAIRAQIVEARGQVSQLSSIVRAFEQRKDMLILLNSRKNTGIWQDKDADIVVSARVERLADQFRGVGIHPSKQKKEI